MSPRSRRRDSRSLGSRAKGFASRANPGDADNAALTRVGPGGSTIRQHQDQQGSPAQNSGGDPYHRSPAMPKPSEGIPAYPDCELVPATAEKHELQSRVRSELQRIGFSGAYTFMQCYPAYWILETIDEAQYHDLSNPGGWVRKQVRERFTNYLCNWMRDDVY